MYDARITVVPRATTGQVFTVKPSQKQRIVVLLFTGIHFDTLLPGSGKPLPKSIKDVVTEPPKGGGGCRCTVWSDDGAPAGPASGRFCRQTFLPHSVDGAVVGVETQGSECCGWELPGHRQATGDLGILEWNLNVSGFRVSGFFMVLGCGVEASRYS